MKISIELTPEDKTSIYVESLNEVPRNIGKLISKYKKHVKTNSEYHKLYDSLKKTIVPTVPDVKDYLETEKSLGIYKKKMGHITKKVAAFKEALVTNPLHKEYWKMYEY